MPILWLSAVSVAACLSAAFPPVPDEPAARVVVDRLFAAYARKDIDAYMACWAPDARGLKTRREAMTRIFAETGALDLKELSVVRAEAGPTAARFRVRVEIAGSNTKTGRPHRDLGRLNRVVELTRSTVGWRVLRYAPAEVDLADRLGATTTRDARERLLDENRDLVSRVLVAAVTRTAHARLADGDLAAAQRWAELGLEVSGRVADPAAGAESRRVRGLVFGRREPPDYAEARREFVAARDLARQGSDRLTEGRAAYDLGALNRASGRLAAAAVAFEDAHAALAAAGAAPAAADARERLGGVLVAAGLLADGAAALEAAAAEYRALNDVGREAAVLIALADACIRVGAADRALTHARAALDLSRRQKDQAGEASARRQAGRALIALGRADEAASEIAAAGQVDGLVGPEEQDHSAVRRKVRQLLDAYAAGDLDGLTALWSTRGPGAKQFRAFTDSVLATSDHIRFDDLRFARVDIDDDSALVRMHMRWSWRNKKTGGRVSEWYAWNLRLVRETGGWRFTRQMKAHTDLATALYSADTREKRSGLLTDEPDLVGSELLEVLHVWSSGDADKGNFADAFWENQIAFEVATRVGRPRDIGICHTRRGYALSKMSRRDEALAEYRKALAVFRGTKDGNLQAVALDNIGLMYRLTARWSDAEDAYREALPLARAAEDRHTEGRVLFGLGLVHAALGRPDEALSTQQASVEVRRRSGDRVGEMDATNAIGDLHWAAGRYPDALTAYRHCLKTAVQIGHESWAAHAREKVANTMVEQGVFADVLPFYEAALVYRRKVKDRRGEAITLHQIGNLHLHTGDWVEAQKSYKASLAVKRELGDRSGEASELGAIGLAHMDLGHLTEARTMMEAGLKLARETGDRDLEALILGNLGLLESAAGRSDEAIRMHGASLALYRVQKNDWKARGQQNNIAILLVRRGKLAEGMAIYESNLRAARAAGLKRELVTALINLSRVRQQIGRSAEALAGYMEALALARPTGDRRTVALILGNIGALHGDLGRYAESKMVYDEALAIERAMGNRSGEAKLLGNLAMEAAELGRYREALVLFRTSRALAREAGAREWEASAAVGIGDVYNQTGRYADALLAYEEGLALCRAMGNPLKEANTRRHVANLYANTGRDVDALREYEAALKACVTAGAIQNEAWARGALAGMYHKLKRYAEAATEYEACLRIARELGDRPTEAKGLGDVAITYYALGRKADARAAYESSLKLDREFENLSGTASTLLNLGGYYYKEGEYSKALAYYAESLALAERIGQAKTAFNAHLNIGLVHHKQKDWSRAVAEYRLAVAGIERTRGLTRERDLQAGFLAEHTQSYHLLADCLQAAGDPTAALEAAEQVKARALADLLEAGRANIRKAMTADEAREEQRLAADVAEAAFTLHAARSRPGRSAAEVQALTRRLDEARAAEDAYRRALFLAHPELQVQRAAFAPATLRDLNRTLFADQPDLVVLSYLLAGDDVLIFALTRGEAADGPARLRLYRVRVGEEFKAEVEALRRACLQPAAGASTSNALYDWLIAPAEADLEGKTHLVILPDGVLHTVPFQVLRGPDRKYLIERVSVSYAPSATALVKMRALADRRRRERGGAPAELLAVGRPAFGPGLADLPSSEAEAKAVAALYPGRATLLLGPAADKAAVTSALPAVRYAHLATHGLVNEANPLYSAVALAARPGGDDGLLYARDLIDLELRAELVVLSACETALGRVTGGEGVLGLTWAVFVAGSPSAIVSQWSVSDATTRTLMTEFHRRLAAGSTKAAALRYAQLEMLRDRKTRHPFHWAPFVLVGDWRD
jgi:CHAT domain-containing protein/ketosteroid isomerase-like protein